MLNQLSWMSVDSSTGVISGSPDGAAVGLTPTKLFYMLEGPKSINGRNFSVSVTAPEINATSISTGDRSSCALDNSSGMVKCWGGGGALGLGDSDTNNRGDAANEMGSNLGFVDLGTGRTATAISVGSSSCAILDNGSVKCWGSNANGRLGLGDTNNRGNAANEMGDNLPIVDLGTGRTATVISGGSAHNCAILDNASVKCWGRGRVGALGIGNTNDMGDAANEMGDNLPAVDLGTGRTATAISSGGEHNCALLDNASVKCWGAGNWGRLGQGNTNNLGDAANEMGDNLPIVDLGTGRTATVISAGSAHTCALLDNASVKCWGNNDSGQLGLGDTNHRGDAANEMGDNLTIVDLGTGRTATAISAGGYSNCAILDNASVKCWGSNSSGKLGIGNTNNMGDAANEMGDNLPAVDLGTGRTATAISVGNDYTCAMLDNSDIKCWGYGNGGLGQGTTSNIGNNANMMGDNLPAIDL
jgi:alpha-tubulin suppressor-like RCC1 family protein